MTDTKTRDMCHAQRCRETGVVLTSTARWCAPHWERRQRKGRLYRLRKVIRAYWAAGGIPEACTYCGGPFEEVDHFIPLALGGSDEFANLVPACADCNAEKFVRDPDEVAAWLIGRAS